MEQNTKISKIENPLISDGMHLLSGVDEFRIEQGWGDDIDGWAIILDGDLYIVYRDPSDGYRSYAGVRMASEHEREAINVINKFPPQEVYAVSYNEIIEEDGWSIKDAESLRLNNFRGDPIFEITTDYSESYYPCGHVSYNPENLPINIKR